MKTPTDHSPARRIWIGDTTTRETTRLFRRTFHLPGDRPIKQARLLLFVDSRYHVWINGTYLGRGPTFFHPHRRPLMKYDLADFLHAGPNIIAVLVHSIGYALHNYIPCGTPGMVARLDVSFDRGAPFMMVSDRHWRGTDRTGWRHETPRRGWALSGVECFDATTAPAGWQDIGFDDSEWPLAQERPHFPRGMRGTYQISDVPNLRFTWQPATRVLGTAPLRGKPPPFQRASVKKSWGEMLTVQLDAAGSPQSFQGQMDDQGGIHLADADGIAIALDLGREYCGAVAFNMESATGGVIDIGWSERLLHGWPQLLQKRTTYADRFIARPGRNKWLPLNFSAGRYVVVMLYGFKGPVHFERLGMLASEPDLVWPATFTSEDSRLNAIWDLSVRSLQVGSQEGLMDCPTREQATYAGDGNPCAEWIGRLTGDYSYWRRLLRETFAVQSPEGLVKTQTFSGMRFVLLDYALLSVIGVANYLRDTGDQTLVREVLPACRRLLAWFERRLRLDLFNYPSETMPKEAAWITRGKATDALDKPGLMLFIDHPGTGWHNVEEPGIERRGVNAAINALLAQACRAMFDLCQATGASDGGHYANLADRIAAAGGVFWNSKAGAFADGLQGGVPIEQVSQQTNIWCMAAGFPAPVSNKQLIARIFDSSDTKIARSGPYFWNYHYPVLMQNEGEKRALKETRRLWGRMLKGGATTLWETFAGDHLDSYCHPWSGAPLELFTRHIVGIGSLPAGAKAIDLNPRIGLLKSIESGIMTPRGPVRLGWRHTADGCILHGALPEGVAGRLRVGPDKIVVVHGSWKKIL